MICGAYSFGDLVVFFFGFSKVGLPKRGIPGEWGYLMRQRLKYMIVPGLNPSDTKPEYKKSDYGVPIMG